MSSELLVRSSALVGPSAEPVRLMVNPLSFAKLLPPALVFCAFLVCSGERCSHGLIRFLGAERVEADDAPSDEGLWREAVALMGFRLDLTLE